MSRGYRLRPWRSPYLRWRIETFSGIHADQIGFREFWRFTWARRRELARYLKWAALMQATANGRTPPGIRYS
ncbi:MAG TPA: hypothetical protein VHW24_13530 [Bryobacteraceae bacterium]|jgi:hypothetical protein|nr:hypothetical protein [Bryobacteraceae bacterium]